ncbi:hypothetical protein Sjap_010053 [Stephania japonica]|uniref:Myb/SANT-like domain-containing protein n=1 Tax=Stephania japonica TaxID=461633 RepID=A0AAP0P6S6_9MAGN
MREMVDAGVYKADNGFKPGYLHFLEEKMRASCPSSGFKAKPHIESRVKTLKKDWTTVHDILTGVRHGCSGFGYDNGTNTIVASDDVWVDYIKIGVKAVVVALEEVYGIPPIERAIYATKLAKGNELMVGFLSLDPTYRLAWLQRMFPDVM